MNHIFIVNASVSGKKGLRGEVLYWVKGTTLGWPQRGAEIRAMSLLAAFRTVGFRLLWIPESSLDKLAEHAESAGLVTCIRGLTLRP